MNRQDHWNAVYGRKGDRDTSWFEDVPAVSIRLIEAAGLAPDTCVIDIGGGDARLVDALLAKGITCLAVLDVSGAALRRAQSRIGSASAAVTWIESDVTGDWSVNPMDIWHDRAVFHFLTAPQDRVRYVAHLRRTVKPLGAVIVATFSSDGPEQCSGLQVMRYSPETLAAELGGDFALVQSVPHLHRTPQGAAQSFQYSRLQRTRG